MSRRLAAIAAFLMALVGGPAGAVPGDAEEKQWLEGEVTLPAFPQDADLIEFNVSAATANRFFIDGKTLSVGSDGVVRYALIVTTAGGATNVSYEGIRCRAREIKLYATGRSDRTWSHSRVAEWRRIENNLVNRHHATLLREYFCPHGVGIRNAAEGRDALRRGGHPQAD